MKLRGKKFKAAIVVGTFVLLIILVLISPFFFVQEIIVIGNVRVSQADILNRLDLSNTSNILMFNTRYARRRIMGNLYIGEVIFRRDLPGRLYVTVRERRPSAYVEHMPGSFLVLDDFGRVLEIRQSFSEPLPLLEGLRFTSWQLGEILEVPNATDFSAIVHYTQLLVTHDLIHRITHINVADPSNIRILVNYMEFHVGCAADADYKVRTIVAMLEQSPYAGNIRGFVDMRERRAEYFFVLLQ